jgi:hypothetical protein
VSRLCLYSVYAVACRERFKILLKGRTDQNNFFSSFKVVPINDKCLVNNCHRTENTEQMCSVVSCKFTQVLVRIDFLIKSNNTLTYVMHHRHLVFHENS